MTSHAFCCLLGDTIQLWSTVEYLAVDLYKIWLPRVYLPLARYLNTDKINEYL